MGWFLLGWGESCVFSSDPSLGVYIILCSNLSKGKDKEGMRERVWQSEEGWGLKAGAKRA